MSIHSAAGRQSSIPELVRDVTMLKMCFYSPLPMSLSETLSTHWCWCCITLPHTSTPSQLAKNAKMCCQIHQKWTFLPNLHKIHDILIFVIFQGQEQCKISNLVTPKVKNVAEFNFHDLKGEGHLRFLFSRSRTKISLKTPWPNFMDPISANQWPPLRQTDQSWVSRVLEAGNFV